MIKKREREEGRMRLDEGGALLDLEPLGVGAKPLFSWACPLWPPCIVYTCMLACMEITFHLCIQWSEIFLHAYGSWF